MKYGTNTQEIESLIGKVKTLTPEQAEALGAAWDETWDATWDARGAARVAALDAARGAALGATWDATWDALDATWDALDAARDPASAVYDALLALVVKDLISPEEFDVLYRPWREVMEAGNG